MFVHHLRWNLIVFDLLSTNSVLKMSKMSMGFVYLFVCLSVCSDPNCYALLTASARCIEFLPLVRSSIYTYAINFSVIKKLQKNNMHLTHNIIYLLANSKNTT